jgi:hypothetical protein
MTGAIGNKLVTSGSWLEWPMTVEWSLIAQRTHLRKAEIDGLFDSQFRCVQESDIENGT